MHQSSTFTLYRGMLALTAAMLLTSCAGTGERTGELIDDSVITTKVKSALVKDPKTSASDINVETNKGVVQLSGFVRDDDERARALELAKNTKGVVKVDDKTSLKAEAQ